MTILIRTHLKRALVLLAIVLLNSTGPLESQEVRKTYVDQPTLVTSQLGFRQLGPKTVTLLPSPQDSVFPNEIPFYVDRLLARMKREQHLPKAWTGAFFDWPFDIDKGKYVGDRSGAGVSAYRGTLKKVATRWGIFYQGDFTEFAQPGLYQIET